MSADRPAYPSDVSDEGWALVAPYLALLRESSVQRDHDLREVFNGLRFIVKTGAPWRFLPHDLPPWAAVYQQTQRWLAAGCFPSQHAGGTIWHMGGRWGDPDRGPGPNVVRARGGAADRKDGPRKKGGVMLHTLTPLFIAGSTILGSLLLGGRDHRHGHEASVMLIACLVCAALGVVGEMA